MKEQKKLICIVASIIIIVGFIIVLTKGFNIELFYSSRQEIVLVSDVQIDAKEIETISKEVLTDKKIKVQEVDRFGKIVEITSSEITEDERDSIVGKVNEKYNVSISNDDVGITSVPNTRIRDILKPYILPGVITFVFCLLYFVMVYHRIGLKNVLLKGFFTPIVVELTYYSVIAITRIPFGRVVNSIAIGIYVLTISILLDIFKKEKSKINKKENEK